MAKVTIEPLLIKTYLYYILLILGIGPPWSPAPPTARHRYLFVGSGIITLKSNGWAYVLNHTIA